MAWTHRPMPPVPTPPPLSRLRRHPADTNTNANGRRKPPMNTKTTARTIPVSAGSPPHLEPRPSPHCPRGMRAYVKGRKPRSRNRGQARNKGDGVIPFIENAKYPKKDRQDAYTTEPRTRMRTPAAMVPTCSCFIIPYNKFSFDV